MKIQYTSLKSKIARDEELREVRNNYLNEISKFGAFEFEASDSQNSAPYLFLIETGGTEEIFKEIVNSIDGPCYLLTTGLNNSLPAAIEIQSFMDQLGKKCQIIHGESKSIAIRLIEIFEFHSNVLKQKLGVVGKPSDWLIGSMTNYENIYEKSFIELVDISSKEFETEINKKEYVKTNRTEELLSKWENTSEMEMALYIYGALKRLIIKYELNGLTVRCFDLLSKFHNTSCLALGLLNEEGYTATCEGDVPSMISMHLCTMLLKEQSFQANPSMINVEDNSVIFAHCTIPFGMINEYKLMTHFESGIGIAIRGQMKLGTCTVLRFNKDLSKAFVCLGNIDENQETELRCRTQIKVTLFKDVRYFFNNPCGNHHIIIYGNHIDEITEYCRSIGCEIL